MKKLIVLLLVFVLVFALVACGGGNAKSSGGGDGASSEATSESSGGGGGAAKDMTFVIVPKVVHWWFEAVNTGAQAHAKVMSEQLGVKVTVDYRAPKNAEVTEQNTILEQAAAMKPTGITLDPLDAEGNRQVLEEIQAQGIAVVYFDASPNPGQNIPSVSIDEHEQGWLQGLALANAIGFKGKVGVQHGVPTAPGHIKRHDAIVAALSQYPDIEVVSAGASQDLIETSQQQAASFLAGNPDAVGIIGSDAAAPIGIPQALKEAGMAGQCKYIGCEFSDEILDFIDDGTTTANVCTVAGNMGVWALEVMYAMSIGVQPPYFIDTGLGWVDPNNAAQWRAFNHGEGPIPENRGWPTDRKTILGPDANTR